MINTSIAFRRALQGDREFRVKDRIILKNKKEVPISLNDLMEYRINEATSASGKFEIGAAVIKEYDITLDDSDEQYDGYDFEDADIEAVIGLKLENDTWEDLKKGSYRVYKATFGESTLEIRAYDAMLFFDRPYSDSSLSYPATIQQIIADACRTCQVAYDASTIEMGNYRVDTKPEGNLTFRDVISYCAQIMGCYARINHLGRLAFGWYDFSIGLSGGMDGGVFDTASTAQYVSGDFFDGGTFDDYSDGEEYDSGGLSDTDAYHHFYDLYSSSVNGSDVNVTGVQITIKQDNSEEKYLYGTDSYALEIKDNPLIRAGTLAQVAKHIGGKIINKPFRPLSISIQSNPAIEAGDSAVVTPRKLTAYTTVITDTTFSLGGAQTVSSAAETPTEKTFTRYSAATKILDAARKEMDISMSDYDLAVQQMNQLAANTLGFYQTAVKQEDGSLIVYRHDKPKLAESKIVYKSGIDGFFVTQNYTGKDSTTSWKNGFDSSGNAALNILSVIGIHWDWASGGTLTLGGKGNGNGELKVLDENGNIIGIWDKDGIQASKGTFSGNLSGAGGTFSGNLQAAGGTFKGNLEAAGGSFSGKISAAEGTIAGWNIEKDSLSKDGAVISSQGSIDEIQLFGDRDKTHIYPDGISTKRVEGRLCYVAKNYTGYTGTLKVVTDVNGSTVSYKEIIVRDGCIVTKSN